jgi:hypothetical protein
MYIQYLSKKKLFLLVPPFPKKCEYLVTVFCSFSKKGKEKRILKENRRRNQ